MKLNIREMQTYGSEMLRTVADICERNRIRWYMAYGSMLGAIRHSGPIPWDSDIDIYVPDCDLPAFLDAMKRELPDKYWVDYRDDPRCPRVFPRIGLSGYETERLHIDVYRLGGLPEDLKEYKRFVRFSRYLFVIWKSKTLDINYYYPDLKRRFVSKTVKALTCLIPLKTILNLMDRQAGRIPFDEAKIVASPLTTESRKRTYDRSLFSESILVRYEDFQARVPKDYELYLRAQFGDWEKFPPEAEREKALNKIYEVRELTEG